MQNSKEEIIVFDKLTYSSNFKQVQKFKKKKDIFFKGDIKNRTQVSEIFKKYKPRKVINFAAESHVDNSINSPTSLLIQI